MSPDPGEGETFELFGSQPPECDLLAVGLVIRAG